jgi:phosphoribosylamine--glycine ligase / phosphoribosylformylglycinamidine cyclo-ligase
MDSVSFNVVIKASGLAEGKGVIIPSTKEEAKMALQRIMLDKIFGAAGIPSQCLAHRQAMK